jgi:hypothetical protein
VPPPAAAAEADGLGAADGAGLSSGAESADAAGLGLAAEWAAGFVGCVCARATVAITVTAATSEPAASLPLIRMETMVPPNPSARQEP